MLVGSIFAIAYLDDILTKSESHGLNDEHVEKFLERMK